MKFKYNISVFLSVSECLAQNERKRRDVSGSGFNTLEDAELEQELEEINQKRANYLKAKEYDEIKQIYIKDCMVVMEIEGMPPGVGRKGNCYFI